MKKILSDQDVEDLTESLQAMLDLGPTSDIWKKVLDGQDPSCVCGRTPFMTLSGDDGLSFMWYWDRIYKILDF